MVLSEALQSQYHLRIVTSGVRALRAVELQLPDLILLDMLMPGMDGFEVLGRLREAPATASVPVIFVTSDRNQLEEQRAFECGAADYILKPISVPVVQARVRAQLEARSAREMLRKTNERLVSKVEEGADALEQAQRQLLQSEKLAAMGMLAAGVAHEVMGPIGYVGANLAVLGEYTADLGRVLTAYEALESALAPEALAAVRALKQKVGLDAIAGDIPALVEQTRAGVRQMHTIIRDLKDFSRADDDDWQWSDLHQLIDTSLNIASSELKYHCTIHKRYGTVPEVYCLPSRLQQVFLNLLVNAAHAIEGQGELTITTWRMDDRSVGVQVADTGRGIPANVLPRIFEPFFTTKPPGQGTGLGLPTVATIVERHGGLIEVTSEVGRGTTFTVTLPTHNQR